MRTVLPLTDEPVITEGLRSLIEGSDNLLLKPLSFDIEDLAERLREARPDIVLIRWNEDLSLSELARLCGSPPPYKTILLARDASPELVYQVQETGFSGVLDSRCSRSEILSTLEHCGRDDFAIEYPRGKELRPARTVSMTPREAQLVRLLTQGLKNKEIATCLGITEGTVKVYLSHLFKKAGVKDRFELALFGLKNMVGTGDGATLSAVPFVPPNGDTHDTGTRILVLSELTADEDDDDVRCRSDVSNTSVTAARTRMGLRTSTSQPAPLRITRERR